MCLDRLLNILVMLVRNEQIHGNYLQHIFTVLSYVLITPFNICH
jgi:hypothetical protein